jgi:hypothetical protein
MPVRLLACEGCPDGATAAAETTGWPSGTKEGSAVAEQAAERRDVAAGRY